MSNFLPCPICAMMHFPDGKNEQEKLQQPCRPCNGGPRTTAPIPFFAYRKAQEEAEIVKKLAPSELDALARMGLSVTGQPLKAQEVCE